MDPGSAINRKYPLTRPPVHSAATGYLSCRRISLGNCAAGIGTKKNGFVPMISIYSWRPGCTNHRFSYPGVLYLLVICLLFVAPLRGTSHPILAAAVNSASLSVRIHLYRYHPPPLPRLRAFCRHGARTTLSFADQLPPAGRSRAPHPERPAPEQHHVLLIIE